MSTPTTPPNGMPSNVENILRSILGEEIELPTTPGSRVEYYLMQLKDMIAALAAIEPMVFSGGATLTADTTDTTKVSISVSTTDIKKGYTYKVTSISGTYTGVLKVGDTFIAAKDDPKITADWVDNTDWVVIPTGDETGYILGKVSGTTQGHLMTWGSDGFNAEDSGAAITDNSITLGNGKTLYISDTAPTGARTGDLWIGG